MAGIKITKNYVSTGISNASLTNNWLTLVYGITKEGTTEPTIVQNYSDFTNIYGSKNEDTYAITHNYVKLLLDSGVPVLFQRVLGKNTKAKVVINSTTQEALFTIVANDNKTGTIGNSLAIEIKSEESDSTSRLKFLVYENNIIKETFDLGVLVNQNDGTDLVYAFINNASISSPSNYINFEINDSDKANWANTFTPGIAKQNLQGGTEPTNDLASAVALLSDANSDVFQDAKINGAATYYPQLRFVTTGGIVGSTIESNEAMFKNLADFAIKCNLSFRVLVDYAYDMTDIDTVRKFAETLTDGSACSFTGWWGYNSGDRYPGSAGFLTSLARSGYNVYNRRMAGTGFTPAFNKTYKPVYVDALSTWQDESKVQLNPIVVIDAQNNLAVMGSSTLAKSAGENYRNPAQALDIVCIGDYVAAILNGIALSALRASLDRLTLSSISNRMSQEVERFVTSGAITKFDLNFDTSTLGKLGVECILYFAIGLEEVSITVTSVYDTDLIQ